MIRYLVGYRINSIIEFPQSIVAELKVQIKMLFFKFRT